jgi:hypothetical protein
MGRSEPVKKSQTHSKGPKTLKSRPQRDRRSQERKETKKTKQKALEIEPIDQNENYVVPPGFEVAEEDLALFDKLEALNHLGGSLEKKFVAAKRDSAIKSPASDPEVAEVYEKWAD